MESGQEWKDFFQPFFLDPPHPQQIPGAPESPGPSSLRKERGRYLVGDTGKPGDLSRSRPVDIDPVSQKIFLANPEWGPSRGVNRCGPVRVSVG